RPTLSLGPRTVRLWLARAALPPRLLTRLLRTLAPRKPSPTELRRRTEAVRRLPQQRPVSRGPAAVAVAVAAAADPTAARASRRRSRRISRGPAPRRWRSTRRTWARSVATPRW